MNALPENNLKLIINLSPFRISLDGPTLFTDGQCCQRFSLVTAPTRMVHVFSMLHDASYNKLIYTSNKIRHTYSSVM